MTLKYTIDEKNKTVVLHDVHIITFEIMEALKNRIDNIFNRYTYKENIDKWTVVIDGRKEKIEKILNGTE